MTDRKERTDMDTLIVIDKGTTNLKAVLFDTKGNEIGVVSEPCEMSKARRPGWCEQDMNVIWDVTVRGLKRLKEEYIKDGYKVLGIGITGHGAGIFPVDKDGKPFRDGIVSLDTRASVIIEEWQENGIAEWFLQKKKAEILACYPYSILTWLKRYEKSSYDKIGTVFFVKDWIKYKLTGKMSTDYTDLGPSLLLDVDKMDYDLEDFDKIGIPEMKACMPPIVPSSEIAGTLLDEVAESAGLETGIPVFSGVHDLMASPLGTGAIGEDQLVTVIGTWGCNFTTTDERKGLFSFPHAIPDRFLTGSLDGNSGSVLERMLNLLCPAECYEGTGRDLYGYAEDLIKSSGDDTLIFHPYLFGGLYNANACGGFYGLRDWHTKADMVKAVYEGVVFGHYANIQTIPGHEKIDTLWLVGGGSKSEILAQTFSDITGLTVNTIDVNDVTARGACLIMLVGTGACKSYEEACIPVKVDKTFVPRQAEHAFYEKKYQIYQLIDKGMADAWDAMRREFIR